MKQKQVQNVKIVIGETKRRRAAPRRVAPRRPPPAGAPPVVGSGGGPPRPPPHAGAPSYIPFPQMFPIRQGPVVESQPSLQQLIRPLEQTLARLQGPQQTPRPALEAADIMRYVGRIVSPLYEQIEMLQQPGRLYPLRAAEASSSSQEPLRAAEASSTGMGPQIQEQREIAVQTEFTVPDHTAQIQLVEPPPPLVRARDRPLVDAVVQPSEGKEEAIPYPDVEIEDDDLIEDNDLTVNDIQKLQRQGKITRNYLNKFQVSRLTRNMNLLKIGSALGVDLPAAYRKYPRPTKIEVINYIINALENPQL